jgi:hypothetical protein
MATTATKNKNGTNAVAVAKAAATLREETEKIIWEKFLIERLTHFAQVSGGEWAEYSAQYRSLESIVVQIVDAYAPDSFDGNTVAVHIETGRYARCYGRNTMMKRLDNGNTVAAVVVHISIFSLPFDEFIIKVLEAITHTLLYLESGEIEFGMSVSATHNSTFAKRFATFGFTTKSDDTNKQNFPTELNDELHKFVNNQLKVDSAAFILTGDATPKPKRTPAQVLRLACPSDAKHFATSNIEKRYKGKRPVIDLDCGKCQSKISEAGYAEHNTK